MSAEGLISDFNWRINKGNSKNANTGQQPDVQKPAGAARNGVDEPEDKYMLMDSRAKSLADRARIMTPWLKPTAKCITFSFLMYGATKMGSLDVKAVEIDDRGETFVRVITELHGNQGKNWNYKKATWEASIHGIAAVKFIIDGWVYSEESDIIVDDIEITAGCSQADIVLVDEWECDFDAGDKCDGQDGEVDFSWEIHSQTTPSKSTGPLGDHTTGRGKYLFIEASQPRKRGDRAQLVSPPLTEDLHCLSFWYHMYGEETGSIRVRVKIGKAGRERILWEEKGEKPDKWFRAEVEVNPSFFANDFSQSKKLQEAVEVLEESDREGEGDEDAQDRATSLSGKSKDAMIEYDDAEYDEAEGDEDAEDGNNFANDANYVKLAEYEYEFSDNTVRKRRQATSEKIHNPDTPYMIIGDSVYTRDDYLNMKALAALEKATQMQNDAVKIEKKEKGLYIIIEAERGFGYRGDSALDDVKITNIPCATWAEWAAWGSCSNSCGGGVQQRSRQCFLRNKKKCNGKFDEVQQCNLHTCGGWSCDFNSDLCGMTQLQGDDFDWARKTGYTPSAMTGPTHDITGNGYYMFIEASSPQKTNDVARLESPKFDADTDYCLTFYYHMWGNVTDMPQAVGSMNVYTTTINDGKKRFKKIWGKSRDQGKQWHKATVAVDTNSMEDEGITQFNIVFEAIRGYSYRSDIALDQIVLTNSDCRRVNDAMTETAQQAKEEALNRLNLAEGLSMCTMNYKATPTCDWTQIHKKGEDQTDFTRTNQPSPSSGTGPDHGTGKGTPPRNGEADYFLYLEASDVENNEGAVLRSKTIKAMPYCFEVDYHMYGKNVGGLEIIATEKDEDTVLAENAVEGAVAQNKTAGTISSRSIKKIGGNQENAWHNMRVNYRPENGSYAVNFRIKATRGPGYRPSHESDIAIDNMKVTPGPCIEILNVESDEFTVQWGELRDLIAHNIVITPEVRSFLNGNKTLAGVTVQDLEPETTYNVKVTSFLTEGVTFQTERTITTMPELTGLVAGFVRSSSVRVKWNHDDRFAGYDLQIMPGVDGFVTGVRLGNQTDYEISGLKPSGRYTFYVTGVGKEGIKQYKTNQAKVQMQAMPPPPLLEVKAKSNSILIEWNSVGKLSFVEITSSNGFRMARPLPNKAAEHKIPIANLKSATAYTVKVFGIFHFGRHQANAFKSPTAIETIIKKYPHEIFISDASSHTIQTAPPPPELVVSDRREDSVKVSWPNFADAEEVTFLMTLTPDNQQLYSTAPSDTKDKFIFVQNLQPGREYELTVGARFQEDRITDVSKVKFSVPNNCDRHFHQLSSPTTVISEYSLAESWSFCGWFDPKAEGVFLNISSASQPVVTGRKSLVDGIRRLTFDTYPNMVASVDLDEKEQLSFICAVQNAEENVMSFYHNGRKVTQMPLETTSHPLGIVKAVALGEMTLIDFHLWNYVLLDGEIQIQKTAKCVTGMEPKSNSELSTEMKLRTPETPAIKLVGKRSSVAEMFLQFGDLVTAVYVDLREKVSGEPSISFKNGIQPNIKNSFKFNQLKDDTVYIVDVSSILAGVPSSQGTFEFATSARAPQIQIPSIRSSKALMQWSAVEDAIGYSINIPGNDDGIVVDANVNSIEIDNLNSDSEYTVMVKALFEKPDELDYFESDDARRTFSTAPALQALRGADVRSSELTLKWEVTETPNFYKIDVKPSLPNLDSTIYDNLKLSDDPADLTSSLELNAISPDTLYNITLVAVFSGSESDTFTVQVKSAPLIHNAAVRHLRSTLMIVGWDMVIGAKDVRLNIDPPVSTVENGLQGNFRNMLQLMDLRPLTKYTISISMLLDNSETDTAFIVEETAPSSSGLSVLEVKSTSANIAWTKIENIERYRVQINPRVAGFNGAIDADVNNLVIDGLLPDTRYFVYVSGILLSSGIQTDTSAADFTTAPALSGITMNEIRSTAAKVAWADSESVSSWKFEVSDSVQIADFNRSSKSLFNLMPSHTYTLQLTAIYDSQKSSDTVELTFKTFPKSSSVEVRNVQSTAFNIIWSRVTDAIGYNVNIYPSVGDYDNGIIMGNDNEYLSIYDADPNVLYRVELSAVFPRELFAIRETDVVHATSQTAFLMEEPFALDITETSATVKWNNHFHDASDEEGSGISEAEVDLDDDHLEVIHYRLTINPPVESFDSRRFLKSNMVELSGLRPGTEYRLELVAVLSTGAETDVTESAFKTLGSSLDRIGDAATACALASEQMQSVRTLVACDFEGGTMCGWSQPQRRNRFHWRIDYERSATANKGRQQSKVLLAPYQKRSSNALAVLESPTFSGMTCLSLEVLMFRRHVEQLKIKVKSSEGESVISMLSGPQGDSWIPIRQTIFLPQMIEYQILIEATKGVDWKSAISIDNLVVTSGPCWNQS